jgi:hypothetical protein
MLRNPWIRNRFTVTFGSIAAAILVWNLYVAVNAGGHIHGLVMNGDGQPVAGASVVLSRKTVASVEKLAETNTDANGRYTFDKHGQYAIVVTATANREAARRTIPLWFRNQDIDVAPLVLGR